MIARPLELASHLRPAPRNFDPFFYVNVGLLALFFVFFGSAFVLGPAIGLDFQLPEIAGASRNGAPFTHNITVVNAGQIFAGDGTRTVPELRSWLQEKARTVKQPSLIIFADREVPVALIADITADAKAAGFVDVLAAVNSTKPGPGGEK